MSGPYILNAYPFDYTTVPGNGKLRPLYIRLTTPVERILTLQLTILSQTVIVTIKRFCSVFVLL